MEGRDANGRYVAGHAGNGGRKRRTEEEEIKRALDAALPLDKVLEKLAGAVKRQEGWAITLWLAYHWGKPIERVEHTGENGEPIIHTVEIVKDHGVQETTP